MSPFVQTMILLLLGLIFFALVSIDDRLVKLIEIIKGMRWWK